MTSTYIKWLFIYFLCPSVSVIVVIVIVVVVVVVSYIIFEFIFSPETTDIMMHGYYVHI